jgi:hypothetical protein
MKIIETYSHLNGLEYLCYRHQGIWDELVSIIEQVDAEVCRTKISKEKTTTGKVLYSPIDMNKAFKKLFEANKWQESRAQYYVTANIKLARETLTLSADEQKKIIENAGETAHFAYNQTDFIKERIAVEVQFGKYAFVAYDLFVKHMAFYIGNQIDLGIEILPMKSLARVMSSGVAYYEGEVYNVIRQGRNTPAVPLVILGIAPQIIPNK